MKIGFDFDGVITDPTELKRRWIMEHLGIDVAPENTSQKKCKSLIGKKAYEEMIDNTYAGELAMQNRIRPEAISVIASLRTHEHLAYIITSRFNHMADCARQLISMHGVPHDGFFNTEEAPKYEICQKLGVELFVDDTQSKLIELAGIPGIKLVFFNVFGEETASGLVSVASWEELEKLICEIQ